MEITYRRRRPDGRVERLLAWLLPASRPDAPVGRLDMVHTEAIEILSPKS